MCSDGKYVNKRPTCLLHCGTLKVILFWFLQQINKTRKINEGKCGNYISLLSLSLSLSLITTLSMLSQNICFFKWCKLFRYTETGNKEKNKIKCSSVIAQRTRDFRDWFCDLNLNTHKNIQHIFATWQRAPFPCFALLATFSTSFYITPGLLFFR